MSKEELLQLLRVANEFIASFAEGSVFSADGAASAVTSGEQVQAEAIGGELAELEASPSTTEAA